MFNKVILIFVGGGVGACWREIMVLAMPSLYHGIPVSIFVVNMIASFLIGIFHTLNENGPEDSDVRLFLTIGVMGGLSTFGSFLLSAITLSAVPNLFWTSVIFLVASLAGGFLLAQFGLWLGRLRHVKS